MRSWSRLAFWSSLLVALSGCGSRNPSRQVPVITADAGKVGRYGPWAPIQPQSPPLNVILITLDTTRADHLSCYGFSKATTPRIDQIAREGVIFDRALTPIPVTLAAHSTIMTGLYPYQHGVRYNGNYALASHFTTLAEVLKARGYETAAVIGGYPLDHRFGIAQGFESYDDSLPSASHLGGAEEAQRPAGEVTRRALRWLDRSHPNPFFLWLHYYDPHAPYTPPEPFKSKFPGDPYSGEIATMDSAIGAFVDTLKARGLLEHSLLVLIGDHGESLGEHRETTHSFFIYDGTEHVPLIIRPPQGGPVSGPAWQQGRHVPGLVSEVDVLPTILNLIGFADSDRPLTMGKSLVPVVEGTEPGHAWVYHETLVPYLEYGWSDLRGFETDRWKFILAPQVELYDLRSDPGEKINLARKQAKLANALQADLLVLLSLDVGGEAGKVPMDKETVEKLRSLGYLGGATTPSSSSPHTTGPDPKDMIDAYESTNRAYAFESAGQAAAALASIDSVLAHSPDAETALKIKASCLVQLKRGDEAIPIYTRLIAATGHGPEELELLQYNVMAYVAAGRIDDALKQMDVLLKTYPEEQGLHLLEATIYETAGDRKSAEKAIDDEIHLAPRSIDALIARGDLALSEKDLAGARKAYQDAINLSPSSAAALAKMAEIYVSLGQEPQARDLVDRALASDPGQPDACFRKAWFLRKDGMTQGAIPYYLRALAGHPDDEVILIDLANVYLAMSDLGDAKQLYLRAIATGRAPINAYENLGVALAQQGDLAGAINQWNEALKRDPNTPDAASIRQNIEMAHRQLGR